MKIVFLKLVRIHALPFALFIGRKTFAMTKHYKMQINFEKV